MADVFVLTHSLHASLVSDKRKSEFKQDIQYFIQCLGKIETEVETYSYIWCLLLEHYRDAVEQPSTDWLNSQIIRLNNEQLLLTPYSLYFLVRAKALQKAGSPFASRSWMIELESCFNQKKNCTVDESKSGNVTTRTIWMYKERFGIPFFYDIGFPPLNPNYVYSINVDTTSQPTQTPTQPVAAASSDRKRELVETHGEMKAEMMSSHVWEELEGAIPKEFDDAVYIFDLFEYCRVKDDDKKVNVTGESHGAVDLDGISIGDLSSKNVIEYLNARVVMRMTEDERKKKKEKFSKNNLNKCLNLFKGSANESDSNEYVVMLERLFKIIRKLIMRLGSGKSERSILLRDNANELIKQACEGRRTKIENEFKTIVSTDASDATSKLKLFLGGFKKELEYVLTFTTNSTESLFKVEYVRTMLPEWIRQFHLTFLSSLDGSRKIRVLLEKEAEKLNGVFPSYPKLNVLIESYKGLLSQYENDVYIQLVGPRTPFDHTRLSAPTEEIMKLFGTEIEQTLTPLQDSVSSLTKKVATLLKLKKEFQRMNTIPVSIWMC